MPRSLTLNFFSGTLLAFVVTFTVLISPFIHIRSSHTAMTLSTWQGHSLPSSCHPHRSLLPPPGNGAGKHHTLQRQQCEVRPEVRVKGRSSRDSGKTERMKGAASRESKSEQVVFLFPDEFYPRKFKGSGKEGSLQRKALENAPQLRQC